MSLFGKKFGKKSGAPATETMPAPRTTPIPMPVSTRKLNSAISEIEGTFKEMYQSKMAQESASCCISLFNKAKNYDVPDNYEHIISFLVNLTIAEISDPDSKALESGLMIAAQYAILDKTGSKTAADTLQTIIEDVAKAFKINLENTDPLYLKNYCQKNNIPVPVELEPMLSEEPPVLTFRKYA